MVKSGDSLISRIWRFRSVLVLSLADSLFAGNNNCFPFYLILKLKKRNVANLVRGKLQKLFVSKLLLAKQFCFSSGQPTWKFVHWICLKLVWWFVVVFCSDTHHFHLTFLNDLGQKRQKKINSFFICSVGGFHTRSFFYLPRYEHFPKKRFTASMANGQLKKLMRPLSPRNA